MKMMIKINTDDNDENWWRLMSRTKEVNLIFSYFLLLFLFSLWFIFFILLLELGLGLEWQYHNVT